MIGETLGHYEIVALLGRGGMGEVYLARDSRLDREVALKILPAKLATDTDRLERFHREARTVAGLNHPNIVHMYSVEENRGVRFLTMEYVEGEELTARIGAEGLPTGQVLEIGIALADALAEAHDKGVVHRDLKPANVMITPEGRVKVLDFGLAKLLHEEVVADDDVTRALELTRQGSVLGTVPYMAPEQLRGQEIDHRCDLFALGVILYELATGTRPFQGSNAADLTSSILKDDPPSPLVSRPDLPPRLVAILESCLQKDRDRRPTTAARVRDELREFSQEFEVERSRERSGSSWSSAATPRPRRRALALAIPLLVVLSALGWWATQRTPAGPDTVERPVVAVLPFENLGGADDAYFAAGITDEITSRLGLIEGLGVISRTSARLYADSDKSIPEVGRELGADYVLEGATRWDKTQEPGRVRITPRLIRVADDTNLWSDNYEREATEVFALQAAIASRIAEALDITLVAPVRAALDQRPTQDLDAYQAYLQGLKHLDAPGFGREPFTLGVRMFQRAVTLDPDFGLAHARLASMHARMYHYGFDRSEERLQRARQAAERALELSPERPESRLAMAHYHYWGTREYDRALEQLDIARELSPVDSEILLTTAYVLRRQGDLEGAAELLLRDRRLSPLDPNVVVALGETLGTLRRYAEAEEAYRRAMVLAPDDPYPYSELALLQLRWRGDVDTAREILDRMPGLDNAETRRVRFLVELLDRRGDRALEVLAVSPDPVFEAGSFYTPTALLAGMVHRVQHDADTARAAFEEARAELEQRLAENPDDHRIHGALGLAYAGLGEREPALRHALRATELHPLSADALSAPVQIVNLALVYAMLGEAEVALDQLGRVLSVPSTLSVAWLRMDPRWDGLRGHPGFAELLARYDEDPR